MPRPKPAVVDGNRVSFADSTPTTEYWAVAVNNYSSTSPAYVQMNETIKYLDASYDALPDHGPVPGPNKDSWIAAAAPYLGGPVCGCLGTTIDPKKYFRLVNFALVLQGIPILLVPAIGPLKQQTGIVHVNKTLSFPPGFRFCELLINGPIIPAADILCVFNNGGGMGAPQVIVPAGVNPLHAVEGSAEYGILSNLTDNPKQSFCCFYTDGTPCGAGKTRIFSS